MIPVLVCPTGIGRLYEWCSLLDGGLLLRLFCGGCERLGFSFFLSALFFATLIGWITFVSINLCFHHRDIGILIFLSFPSCLCLFPNMPGRRDHTRLPTCVARLWVASITLLSVYIVGVAQPVTSFSLSNTITLSPLWPRPHVNLAAELAGTKGNVIPLRFTPPNVWESNHPTGRNLSRHSRKLDTTPVLHSITMPVRSIHRIAKLCLWQVWTSEPRLGEADNPGPVGVTTPEDQSDLCHLTIVNITKLRKHQDEVLKLYSSRPGIICCAETSSDTTMHRLFQKQARQRNLQYHSGAPCAPSKLEARIRMYHTLEELECFAHTLLGCVRSFDRRPSGTAPGTRKQS